MPRSQEFGVRKLMGASCSGFPDEASECKKGLRNYLFTECVLFKCDANEPERGKNHTNKNASLTRFGETLQ